MKVAQEKQNHRLFDEEKINFILIFSISLHCRTCVFVCFYVQWMHHEKWILVFDSIAMRSIFNKQIDKITVNLRHCMLTVFYAK